MLFPDGLSGQEDDAEWVARRTELLGKASLAIAREVVALGQPAKPEDFADRAARLRLARDNPLRRGTSEAAAYAQSCEIMGYAEGPESRTEDGEGG